MEWIAVAIIGGIIGTLVSFIGQSVRMHQAVSILLGVIGGLAGGTLARITGFYSFGAWTFYAAGALVAIGFLAGGLLAQTLTNSERRV